MTLYHGSREGLFGPICPQSRTACDFGKGFYLGTASAQPLTLICRSERPTLYACELDLVIFGKIANDKMFYALDFFFDNLASDTAVLKSLSALNLGDQYCAKTARACRQIIVLSSREIGVGECAKLQRRSETQRTRAAAIVDRIMDENRRDGLLFKELLEQKAEAFA